MNPSSDFEQIDPARLSGFDSVLLAAAVAAPRPIFVVTTVGPTGVVNAAPFSSFATVSASPLTLLWAIHRHPDGSRKDTARNLLASRQFVLNSATVPMADAITAAGAPFPADVSEAEKVGWQLLPGHRVGAPRLAASPVQLECELEEHRTLARDTIDLFFGRVLLVHARPDVLIDGRVDPVRVGALGHLDPGRFAAPGPVIDHRDRRQDE